MQKARGESRVSYDGGGMLEWHPASVTYAASLRTYCITFEYISRWEMACLLCSACCGYFCLSIPGFALNLRREEGLSIPVDARLSSIPVDALCVEEGGRKKG